MRRSLVLTNESARHWLRASLPPHVRGNIAPVRRWDSWRLTRSDLRDFLLTYSAGCVAALLFFS